MKTSLSNFKQQGPGFWIFISVVLIGLLGLIIGSFSAGMSGDEITHNTHAKNVYNFYTTWGRDSTAVTMTPEYNLPTYGQVIDNFSYAVARILGIEDIMQVRHTTNAICGWLAMFFAGLLAFRLSNKKWLPAIITFVLMFFSPRFFGHSLNNLKDSNLATAMIMGIYYMVVFLQEFPKVRKRTIAMLIVSLGFAVAVRIGGLLLIAYFGLFCLVWLWQHYGLKKLMQKPGSKDFWKMFRYGVLSVLCGYVVAMLLWPYGLVSPIAHVKETFGSMSQFAIAIRQVFEGNLMWSDRLPWYYTPKFILMTIPTAVLIGALLNLILGWRKERRFGSFVLLFCFVFPVFWITYTNANVYGGWRHSMFAYPTLAVMAGLGFYELIQRFSKSRVLTLLFTALPFVLLIGPITHTIRNHPYEYVYFNELSGGVKKAFGNYELDYYYHSTREASEWVIAHAERSGMESGSKIVVATWHLPSVAYYFRNDTAKFQPTFARWYERGNSDWDYAIFTVTGINPSLLRNGEAFPPKNTVYQVKVDGKPICIVLKREHKLDWAAHQYQEKKQMDSAELVYQKVLALDPNNEVAYTNMSEMALMQQRYDVSLQRSDALLAIDSDNENGMYFKGYALMMTTRYAEAEQVLKKLVEQNPKQSSGLWLLANLYASTGNIMQMDKVLEQVLIQNPQMQNDVLNLMKRAYPQIRMTEADATRSFYRMMGKALRELGYPDEALQYENAAR